MREEDGVFVAVGAGFDLDTELETVDWIFNCWIQSKSPGFMSAVVSSKVSSGCVLHPKLATGTLGAGLGSSETREDLAELRRRVFDGLFTGTCGADLTSSGRVDLAELRRCDFDGERLFEVERSLTRLLGHSLGISGLGSGAGPSAFLFSFLRSKSHR